MTDDLDNLRPEVVYALKFIEGVRLFVTSKQRIKKPEGDDLFDESVETIRAELLRLAVRNAELEAKATRDHEWFNDLLTENKKAEAELAAIRARIAEAPVAYLTSKTGVGPCNVASMAHGVVFDSSSYGKRVRLLVEE